MKSDVVIIGAGVLGVSLAYHLAKANLTVTVLERESTFAKHASGKNSGMIRQLYRHEQLTQWAHRSILEWPEALRSHCFKQTGSMILGRELPNHHPELFQHQVKDVSSENGTIELSAIYTPSDGLLDPYDFIYGLYHLTNKKRVQYLFHKTVLDIKRIGRDLEITTNDTQTHSAPWVVNAAGAWVNDFLPPAHKLPSCPYARHLFVVTGWDEDYMPEDNIGFYWDEYHNWYMRLWEKNSRLVSICDRQKANPSSFVPREDLLYEVSKKLTMAIPHVSSQLHVGASWHCFRTYTEDQLPIWGEDANVKGLFWLAAFGGFGMSTAFAAALDAANILCGKGAFVSSDLYPQRFRGEEERKVAYE